jgi:hypothetical protein
MVALLNVPQSPGISEGIRTSLKTKTRDISITYIVAEREGFEPPIRLPVCRISSAVLSTTQPPLQIADIIWLFAFCQDAPSVVATEFAAERCELRIRAGAREHDPGQHAPPPQRRARVLMIRHLHARRNDRIIGWHLIAAGCGARGWDDGGVALGAAVGGYKHLVLAALHGAGCLVAACTNDANAGWRTRWAWIAFRPWRAGRAFITHRSLRTLAATHQGSG